jgi:L-histidine N-alpha-methyltransferase
MSSARMTDAERITIHRLASAESSLGFAEDVLQGLRAKPKILSPKYFYDELGSHLFEAICCLPEYYLTRAESEILAENAEEIVNEGIPSGSPIELIELGSGSSLKTRYFLEALLRRQTEIHYIPIDISAPGLENSSKDLLRAYPSLRITAYAADYSAALTRLARAADLPRLDRLRRIVLFLGSSIGNLDAGQARSLLSEVRHALRPGDILLLGADLQKSPAVLERAYDDELGVTASFNLNLLVRINRELNGDFHVRRFAHRSIYNEEMGRVEMHLVSREVQIVNIQAIEQKVTFEAGESIHTENSYKYQVSSIAELGASSSWHLERTWFDRARQFSFNLLVAV